MIKLNIGDLGGRTARAFGVRGQIPYALDPTIIPVVQVFDATNPIWAQDPIECMCPIVLTGAVGGLRYFVIQNATQGLSVRIKQLTLQFTGASAVPCSLFLARNAVKFGLSFSGAQLNLPGGTARPAAPQAQVSDTTTGITANAATIGQLSLQPNVIVQLPLDVVLYAPVNPAGADQFAVSMPDAVGNNMDGICQWQEAGPL